MASGERRGQSSWLLRLRSREALGVDDGGERRNGFSVVTKSSSSDADQKFPRCQSCGPCTVGGSRASQTRFQVLVGKPQPRRGGAAANCVIGLGSRCGVELNESSSKMQCQKSFVRWYLSWFFHSHIPLSFSISSNSNQDHTARQGVPDKRCSPRQRTMCCRQWTPLKREYFPTSKTCTFCEVGDSIVNVNETPEKETSERGSCEVHGR